MATESIDKQFVIDKRNVDFFIKLMTESHPVVLKATTNAEFLKYEDLLELKKNGLRFI